MNNMKLADISQYQKLSDYLPIFTGTLIADLVIIFIMQVVNGSMPQMVMQI